MSGGWFDALARAFTGTRPRRGVLGVLAALLGLWARSPAPLGRDQTAAAKKKNKRQHRKKHQQRKRRRRRRNACKLLASGAECGDAAQCCSGTCDENTAFPQFDSVCCIALGESCVIGRNECCQEFACRCTTPDCVDFNGDAGTCG